MLKISCDYLQINKLLSNKFVQKIVFFENCLTNLFKNDIVTIIVVTN